MANRSQTSAGLLPVPDRYGLWAMSIRNVVFTGARAHGMSAPVRSLVGYLVYLGLFVGLYLLSGRFAALSGVSAWNLQVGLALGVVLGYGAGALPVVLLGYLAAPPASGAEWLSAGGVIGALSYTLVMGLCIPVYRRLAGGREVDLADRRSFLPFMAMAPAVSFLAPALATGMLAGARLVLPQVGAPGIDVLLQTFWGNLAGVLLFAPAVLMSRRCLGSGVGSAAGTPAGKTKSGGSGARPYAWRVAMLVASFLGSLVLVLEVPSTNELWLFGVISLPLVLAGAAFGLCGVVPMLGAIGMTAVLIGAGAEPVVPLQLAAIAAAGSCSVFGLFVTEQRRYQFTMNHQAALIESVSFATEQLLGMTDQEKNVNEVLRNLAQEANLDRVYVLEHRPNLPDGGYPILHELGVRLGDDQRTAVNLVRSRHIRKHGASMEEGKALVVRRSDLAPEERAPLAISGIREMLILPIFADGHWWGCLGMDQCSSSRPWSTPEVATFEATARVLGALLAHTNVEQQFRQFTGSIPVVFWIASPDVMHKTYVSPAYEQIWGRSRDGIREKPRSWMAAIYHEDYARMSELLEQNPRAEYAEEYRIVRPDRSVRWIRDTGFSVMDASGQINRIVGIAQDITPQKEAEEMLKASEEQIRASLNEKEVLLKEIHHRVKNNLQVISSLLNLQATQIHDEYAAEVFRDSQYRVRAMALVHERLYQSKDLARIDFSGYVRDMTGHLLRSYQSETRGIRLSLKVASLAFDVDTAIPCALIINELVSNSLKYAFPDGRQGEITVSLSEDEDKGGVVMVVSDNGVGLPDGTAFETSDSLGLQLVHSLTNQLNGIVDCSSTDGTRFEIRFDPAEDED